MTRGAETKRARLIEVQTQGVCSAYSLRGTKRRPESVHSDLEQRCSYGPLLTRATETECARSIDTETQAGGVIMEFINNVKAAQGNGGNLGYIYMECTKNQGANVHQHSLDGCGEFRPGGELGTMEALLCAACKCHRNYHRKVEVGQPVLGYTSTTR